MPAALKRNRNALELSAENYPAVREAFNRVLGRCADKLSKQDYELAYDIVGLNEEPSEKFDTLFIDTALYSRPGAPFARARRKRAIDRLAPKAAIKGDSLEAFVAGRLPDAFFSIFQVEQCGSDGRVVVKDLLDAARSLTIMDNSLAASSSPGLVLAGRFLDLGPWHIGFGVISTLRRSEAAAILIALSHGGETAEKRDSLHELVYLCRVHELDLVMHAVEPLISALALVVDQGEADISELVASFNPLAALPDEP